MEEIFKINSFMIQANELRIGNLLLSEEGNIWSVEAEDIYKLVKALSDNNLHFFTEDYQPIPLTPEILEKAGFIRDGDNYHIGSKFSIYNRFGNFGLIGGSLSWREFKFLHQLQNLYFTLTGIELEIKSLK